MNELYVELSKAIDAFNDSRIEKEHIYYHEIIRNIEDRSNDKEIMEMIIELYSESIY